jgi:hypothetical protein
MKLEMSKNVPRKVRSYGSVGNPPGPTTAPIGRVAADASVAGAGVAETGAADPDVPLAVVLGAAPLVPVDAGAVGVVGVALLVGGVVVALELEDVPVPAESDPWLNEIPWKATCERFEIELSCTSIEAVSACSGTAFPSTTRRP